MRRHALYLILFCCLPLNLQLKAQVEAIAPDVPVAAYGAKTISVKYLNRLRYDIDPKLTTDTINAPNPSPLIAPSSSKSPGQGTRLREDTCDSGDADVEECVAALEQDINNRIRNQNDEQACYVLRARQFYRVLLGNEDAIALVRFAVANSEDKSDSSSCQRQLTDSFEATPATQWPFQTIQRLAAKEKFKTPLSKYASLPNSTDKDITDAFSRFQQVAQSNLLWRQRIATIAAAQRGQARTDHDAIPDPDLNDQLSLTLHPSPCNDWYGRGHKDTIKIHAADVFTPPTNPDDITVATNTCLPLSIASTGFGATFLPNPTFGLTHNAAGDQVISKTAVNDQSILYALLYNVRLLPLGRPEKTGMELFLSPGVGLTSASSTTTADWLAGLSLGFARRLLFLTGSVDFGSRTELLPGFQENTPIPTALTTVPTRSTMKVGAMVSLSFGIAPN